MRLLVLGTFAMLGLAESVPAEMAGRAIPDGRFAPRRPSIVRNAEFSPSGRLVVTASDDGMVRLWEVPSGRRVTVLHGHGAAAFGASFSLNGKLVASVGLDATARLWAVPSGRRIAVLRGHAGFLWGAAFSPGGERLATASEEGTVGLWAVPSGRSLRGEPTRTVP